jgi:hypothetical protein
MEKNFEEFLNDKTRVRRRELLSSNFDFKSGGEIGNGLFSSIEFKLGDVIVDYRDIGGWYKVNVDFLNVCIA